MLLAKNKLINELRSFRRKYFEWKYWNSVFKTMKKQSVNSYAKIQNEKSHYFNKPGIVLSFDDSFRVSHWYTYGKEMFGYYDVKVTFNINGIHYLEEQREHTQQEIDMLLELQANGHEIAHHGFKHSRAMSYSNEVGINKWVEEDIVSLFNWMKKQSHSKTNEGFKKPVSFAFPYFNYNEDNIKELVPKYFKIVRGHFHEDNLTPFNHTGFAPSICIDSNKLSNIKHIKKIMKFAKQSGRNLIFTCHSILPDEIDWANFGWGRGKDGEWRISPRTIQAIIYEARKNDLEFYTTSEIAGVATFLDPNLEKSVRELISNPSYPWIPISELSSITELDLSNKNICNIDGLQYFMNLESINLSNNTITDFRLLEKLPKLKNIEISNNSDAV